MKNILKFMISMPVMGYLVLSLAFAMAFATFIEKDFGPAAAQNLVYRSWWFELLLALFIFNLVGSIIQNKTYRKKKLSIFIFHFAFLIIILGAVVTRYISYEGMMHIREGETTDIMTSSDKYVYGFLQDGNKLEEFSFKADLMQGIRNRFKEKISIGDEKYTIELTGIIPNNKGNRNGPARLTFRITGGSVTKEVSIFEKVKRNQETASFDLGTTLLTLSYGHRMIKLPFSLHLKNFQLERYPGSNSPSSYSSDVVLIDKEENLELPYRIYMNHTLKHRGFKFFQSSYDMDEKGTFLSVNHDSLGTTITYIGYLLMAIGMIISIFNKNSHFMKLARKTGVAGKTFVTSTAVTTMLFFASAIPSGNLNAQSNPAEAQIIPAHAAKEFNTVLLQDANGRIEPFYTMASDVLRKTIRKNRYSEQVPAQVVLGMYFYPGKWKHEHMIRISGDIIPELLGIKGKFASYADFFDKDKNFTYKLNDYVQKAYHKRPAERNMFDKDIIKVDERLNVCYLVYSGALFKIFPVKNDPQNRWFSPGDAASLASPKDSLFITLVLNQWLAAVNNGDKDKASQVLSLLKEYQKANGSDIIPSGSKINTEILYEKYDIFGKLASLYGLVGFILLIILFTKIIKQNSKGTVAVKISTWLLLAGFVLHSAGLGVRWYISGHAPWSNGYESMIYIAWAAMLAGLIFVRSTPFALASAAILSALTLFVAHLSWMNPEITNLVPVLKSIWLTIHVSVITASYGFLGMGMIIGFVNLLMYILKSEKNHARLEQQIEILSNVSEMALILGVYFFGMGTFLGGVWANESWGRYWGWDPKETWSLVTGLVYVFVVHMRLIPGMRGYFAFNVASILAFFSVIMTYFGVNYYLSGLHSYAQSDAVPIPSFVFYVLAVLIVMIGYAWIKEQKYAEKPDRPT